MPAERTGGLASSPGREIWLLEMPRRVLSPAAPGEKLATAEELGPSVISGTELERFMAPRAAFDASPLSQCLSSVERPRHQQLGILCRFTHSTLAYGKLISCGGSMQKATRPLQCRYTCTTHQTEGS